MTVDAFSLFTATEQDLEVYNFAPLINLQVSITNDDGTIFPFPGYVSSLFKVYSTRGGIQLKNISSQISLSSNVLYFNCSQQDMTFEDNGKYYYELSYIMSGGYTFLLQYGNLIVL